MFTRANRDTHRADGITPTADIGDRLERAAFAAGCFWGTEEFFAAIPGVTDTIAGYEGGAVDSPTYEQVCTGRTGHAEAVLITYDPDLVAYTTLLEEFFRHHDPTTLNRQGPDRGNQYRSAIFTYNSEQITAAQAAISEYQTHFARRIVTEVTPASTFWPAEEYHQKYTARTGRGGCHVANW
jgi:methionine-S-sulfoxide reductase